MLNILSKFFKKKFVCKGPFSQVYIYYDGRVYFCPDCFMAKNSIIGNLNDNTFEEIWNSKKAQRIRKECLKGIYNFCNPQICYSKSNYNVRFIPNEDIKYKIKQSSYPQMVCFGPDWECNVNCVMCRKEISRLTNEELLKMEATIDNIYLPILRDAKEVTLSTTSDPFASRNTRLLMKKAAEKYPNLRFNLLTNGIMCNKFNCDEIGITERLSNVMVSLHASNKEVYDRVVKNGNFEKATENIKWLKSLKEENKIKELYLAFVVSNENYNDIPSFIEFAKENNAIALFWVCRSWGDNLKKEGEPLEVWKKAHPNFSKLQDVLYKIDMKTQYAFFSPELKLIKKLKEKEVG